MSKPDFIRKGFHTVTPALAIRGAAKAIEFYQKAFNAVEVFRMEGKDGRIVHAEIRIGDSMVMLCDEMPEWNCLSPETLGGSAISLRLYFPDADAQVAQAVAAGATVERPLANHPYGDRSGMVRDPFGYRWGIATQIEEVPLEEAKRRMAGLM